MVDVYGLERGLELMMDAGFPAIDLNLGDNNEYLFREDWRETADRIKTLADRRGVVFNQAHAPFGGGYAMLPMLQKEVVNGRHWATDEELMDYYAIGQCTPGIIAVNTATFVGYKNRGIPGAIAATLGVIAPSLVIIMIIAAFISNFIELSFVSSAFAGIRACVCVLIGSAVVKLAKKSLVDKGAIAIAAVVFVLALFTSVSPALLVVVAGAIGIVLKGGKGEKK